MLNKNKKDPTLVIALVLGFTLILFSSCSDSPVSTDTDEMLTLDLRVNLMKSPDSPSLNVQMDEEEVQVLIDKVNEVWEQANIQWQLESVETVEALNATEFERMIQGQRPRSINVVGSIIPGDKISAAAWDIFLIHDLGGGIGGVYFPSVAAVVQPEIDPTGEAGFEGGLVRIFAHELGHSLGLPHVPCVNEGNLMAPGCFQGSRTRLNESQIESTRNQAMLNGPYRGGAPTMSAEHVH